MPLVYPPDCRIKQTRLNLFKPIESRLQVVRNTISKTRCLWTWIISRIFTSISTSSIRFYSQKYHRACGVASISSAVVRDRAVSRVTLAGSTPVASVTADFYQRTLPHWKMWPILGGWAGGCATRLSQSPVLVGGALVHLPIPTATLSLAITGAGWDLQYVCVSLAHNLSLSILPEGPIFTNHYSEGSATPM